MKMLKLLFISLFLYTGHVVAQCPSTANFNYNISGLDVTVYNNSHVDSASVNQVVFYWEFPENSQSNQQITTDTTTVVQHTYSKAGAHWISLTMHDSLNNCYDTLDTQIFIPCATDFGYQVSGKTAYFQDQSVDSLTYSHWNFGDQSTDSGLNVSHQYAAAGQYQVCHVVMSANCMDSICKTITVGDTTCKAGFSYMVNGDSIYVNDQSSGSNFLYYEFGPDFDTSNSPNTTFTYDSAGTYVLCQYIMNNKTGCSDSYCDTIVVPNNSCKADFTQIADTSQQFTIQIINNSSNLSSHSYFWDFGDDSSSTDRNPTHEYDNFGSYNVCLTVYDSVMNCISTYCDTVGMDSNGVMFRGSFKLVVTDSVLVGLEEKAISNFNIFPNPANNQVYISNMENILDASNLRVLDMQGRELMDRKLNSNDEDYLLNIEGLSPGIYFIKIENASQSVVKKFIKQ